MAQFRCGPSLQRKAGASKRTLSTLSWGHVELALLLGSGVLVLLVLTHQVVHVGLGFCEFHLVHALSCVPVQESLAPEHCGEVLGHTLEHLLNGCGVTSEGHGHFQALWRDIADAALNVV